jgi:hypothetical protein
MLIVRDLRVKAASQPMHGSRRDAMPIGARVACALPVRL